MQIVAVFTGTNGSCGYSTGVQYHLNIGITINDNIYITRKDESGYCEYKTMITFLQNWDYILRK